MKLLKKRWRMRWVKDLPNDLAAECDLDKKTISVLKDLPDSEKLRCMIHECLHACGWWADEEWVDDVSTDIGNILWKQGWRRTKKHP